MYRTVEISDLSWTVYHPDLFINNLLTSHLSYLIVTCKTGDLFLSDSFSTTVKVFWTVLVV